MNHIELLNRALEMLEDVKVSDDYGATVYAARGDEILAMPYHEYAMKHFGCTRDNFTFGDDGECEQMSFWESFVRSQNLEVEWRRGLDTVRAEVEDALGANPDPEENAGKILRSVLELLDAGADEIRTSRAVLVRVCGDNPHRLTPYVNGMGEIMLASEGNGCGDDVMLEDITGWTNAEICERWEDIDLAALRADAEEVRAAGDADNADWIEDWCRTCGEARKVRNGENN